MANDSTSDLNLAEAWVDAYKKGRLLAHWRLHDFLLLYDEVKKINVSPLEVRVVSEAQSSPEKKKAQLVEAKLNAAS